MDNLDQPAELALLDETRGCRECKWFWGPTPPYGPFPSFDFQTDFPEQVPKQLPVVSGGQPWLVARDTGPGQIDPAILHGCRKAPIMTLGINPNMGGFFATPDAACYTYPRFSQAASYAYYYRHRGVFQELIGRDVVRSRLDLDGCLLAPAAGTTREVQRSDSHRWVQIQVTYDDGHDSSLEFAWGPDQVPVIVAKRGARFGAGDPLAGVLRTGDGPTDILATPVGYYVRFQAVLRELERLAGWPNETLRIGEDVSQGDLVACASPGWSKANYDIPQARISENCAGNKRFILRQLLQSQPRVLVFVGRSALAMFADYAPAAPWLREWAERDIFHLLRETTTRPTYLEIEGEGVRLRARVLCTPHFSYADNFEPGVRLSRASWQAFEADHPSDAAVLGAEQRVVRAANADDIVSVRLQPEATHPVLTEQGRTALMAHYYAPIQMLASALFAETQSGQLELSGNRLARAPGGCRFCVNDRWAFPEGCPYPSAAGATVSNAESLRLASALGTRTPDGPPPNAVRVWRGSKRPDLSDQDFVNALVRMFVPATVQMMEPLGLVAYLPSLVPIELDAELPSELALVFYRSQQAYSEATKTPSGRAYGALHGQAFAPWPHSRSDFPVRWEDAVEPGVPYFALDTRANWQEGMTELSIARVDPTSGLDDLRQSLRELRRAPPAGLNGYIFVLEGSFLIRWAHFDRAARASELNEGGLRRMLTSRSVDHPISLDVSAEVSPVPFESGKTLNLTFRKS